MENEEVKSEADFFDLVQLKTSYPKVKINLVGNLHQEKVIHVIQENEESTAPSTDQ